MCCPLANSLPDDWFFLRHGKRVIDHERYQLDFSNPAVREYATSVIDRLVNEYGVGYIKMDYNIEAGIGTEHNSDSFGDGLLRHNRSYLSWLDMIFAKYPNLTIECCSSGAMRASYALLSRHSIQSSSDQTDYLKNAVIAAASSAGICPEQCAVWAYPLRDADEENVAMNMISAMLVRIHQSGHLAQISPAGFNMVTHGISVYKSIRDDIKRSIPFYPTGMPHFSESGSPLVSIAVIPFIWPCGEFPVKTLPSAFLLAKKQFEARNASTLSPWKHNFLIPKTPSMSA